MIKSMLVSVIAAVSVIGSTFSAQVGDEVTAKVTSNVVLLNNDAREITHITLDKGVWRVNGQLDFFERVNEGVSFAGGALNLSPDLAADGTSLFQSADTKSFFGIVGLGLTSRVFNIPADGTKVFLVGYNLSVPASNPPDVVFGGFISGTKIKNN